MGGPGHLENTLKLIQRYLLAYFLTSGFFLISGWWLLDQYLGFSPGSIAAILLTGWLLLSLSVSTIAAWQVSAPLKALSEAILHLSPTPLPIKSPDISKLGLGRELVASVIRQVYELNTAFSATSASAQAADLSLQQLPVAILSIDDDAKIQFVNAKAAEFIGGDKEIIGQNLYALFDIFFEGPETLQDWLNKAKKSSITTQKIWRGVRIAGSDENVRYIDLATSYIKQAEGQKGQILVVIFDETEVYGEQYDSLSFIALAVHELRTPLTILRGYIEVFEEEMDENTSAEQRKFMAKMKASAENLTAFVGNILDVAKIDQDQLVLHLAKESWQEVLSGIIEDMSLRAEVHGKKIDLTIEKSLPEVGIDRISIAEVLTNLIDNAIKYSPEDKKVIKVSSKLTDDGLVETIVQDFGVGIPESGMPHLFEKFSRNYRNRATTSGTGLGLYLSKALINAHGGNIWVRSHEGEGSTFGFTVLPWDRVADKKQTGDNEIVRRAHGWIKNHTLMRK